MRGIFVLFSVFLIVVSGNPPSDKVSGYDGQGLDINRLFERLDSLERRVGYLEAENSKLKQELNAAVKTDRRDSNGERTKNDSSEKLPVGENVQTQDVSVKNPVAKIETIKTVEHKRLLTGGPTKLAVAFRAELSKALNSVGVHQIIEYDVVPLNIGNAYDARHGHFTAPVKGLYLVTATAFSNPNKRELLELVQNGNRLAVLDTGTHTSYSSNCKTLPVLLEQGDMVWVRTYPGQEGEYVGSYNGALHNMFSAVLIAEL